ncbi:MAG: hypothetical protein ACK56I_23670, partial [bacterium]
PGVAGDLAVEQIALDDAADLAVPDPEPAAEPAVEHEALAEAVAVGVEADVGGQAGEQPELAPGVHQGLPIRVRPNGGIPNAGSPDVFRGGVGEAQAQQQRDHRAPPSVAAEGKAGIQAQEASSWQRSSLISCPPERK